MKLLNEGCIVKFIIKDRNFTKEGFATGGITGVDNTKLAFYQEICIEDFPSFRDFKGKSMIIKDGSCGVILKKVGRPWKINQDPNMWHEYDIYEVLTINLRIVQAFRYNLAKI